MFLDPSIWFESWPLFSAFCVFVFHFSGFKLDDFSGFLFPFSCFCFPDFSFFFELDGGAVPIYFNGADSFSRLKN